MELKLSSSRRPRSLAASDSDNDPDREFSGDDDDDDRNHKHRRREIRSQSSEFGTSQSVSSRPFNKRNKPFDNGHPFRENDSQSNGGWNNNSYTSSEREAFLKSDKRHFDLPMFSRPQMDVNHRIGLGQTYFGDSGVARGRGRESWNPHAPRFVSMGFSPVGHQGSVSSNLFAGRGLPNVAGVQNAPWNPYGLLSGIPNGGLDAMHSLGVNSTLRPPMYPPNIGITRQKCRDFEERGFCLRGDMCPMEHGVNRIIVDDVQSLSKFNLPVSLSGGNTLGVGGGSGPLLTGTDSTSFSGDNNKLQSKMGKSKPVKKGTNSDTGCNRDFSSSAAAGNDFYDPDQPLWNKISPDSSAALSQPCSPEIKPAEPVINPSSGTPVEVHDLSALGSIHGSKSRSDLKGKGSMMPNLSGHNDNSKGKEEASNKIQGTSIQGIQVSFEDKGTHALDASHRILNGSSLNTQKPLQKAMRTIFVNGIPQRDNNKEALRSHFQKFGEIIDIYIPSNSERAFVQFSTREEAEAALKAPDAVMGNRFIKLWWANRDRVPDASISIGNNAYISSHTGVAYSGLAQLSVSSKVRINQLPAPKANASHAPSTTSKVNVVPVPDQGKPVFAAGPTLAPSQKKLENLEELKEELRKKQQLLDQKRNEFKRQLDRLEKQAAGVKGEFSAEQPAKRYKVAMATDVAKRLTSHSGDISTSVTLSRAEEVSDNSKPVDIPLVDDPNRTLTRLSQETRSLKMLNIPLSTTEDVTMNRSKLDDQLKAFRIVPPLPNDFADIATLREHFSPFGEVNDVELVNADTDECRAALVTFNTHHSAEKAFQSAKSWKGHDLLFIWVTSSCPGSDVCEHDKYSSSAKEPMSVDMSLRDNGLQEAITQPDGDLAIGTDFTDKIAAPNEKMLDGQPSEDDTEHEKQLSEGDGYLSSDEPSPEKTLGEQSFDEDAERAHEEPSPEDNIEWTHEEQHLSDGDIERTYEERPPTHVDYTYEEHSIPLKRPRRHEEQLSENDVM